jgi:hypothetical protein
MSLPPYERRTKQTLGTSGPTFMRENGTSSTPTEKQGAIADRGSCVAGHRRPTFGGNRIPKKSRNEGRTHDVVDNKGSALGTHDVYENK